MPYGVVPGGSRPIHPGIGGSPAPGTVRGAPDSAEAARPGEVRRRGVVRPDGNLANSCVFCEGWCEVCPIHFRDLGAVSHLRDRTPPVGEQGKGVVRAETDAPAKAPGSGDGDRLSVGRPRLGER
ncbi:hypothetical protein GCM10010206_29340 [Streptomyces cinerochromogenes]|nr:hypothetical protein GCM10010206_29340 [Streptomyces cinerochromogenes]